MSETSAAQQKPVMVGINHVALEVGDAEAALAFYGEIFQLRLRGRGPGRAFIDLGDQFLALFEGPGTGPDRARHFGLVVADRAAVRQRLEALAVPLLPGPGLDFLDPWGNRVQVVEYAGIQFSKTPAVLQGMGLPGLSKTPAALQELRDKGMAEG